MVGFLIHYVLSRNLKEEKIITYIWYILCPQWAQMLPKFIITMEGKRKEKFSQIKMKLNKKNELIYLLKVNLTSMLAGSET